MPPPQKGEKRAREEKEEDEKQEEMKEGEECLLGIDEAGRGPVLGSMVYGICWCPISKTDILSKMGFADSKQLTAEQREKLFADIKNSKLLGWEVDVLSPEEMSAKMMRRNKYNLNAISHDSAIGLIRKALNQGVNVQEVYVDTVGPPDKYQEKLERIFPNIRKIVVSKKADSLFPIVSAASICAKVTRDQELDDWVFKEEGIHGPNKIPKFSREFGSGYPADPSCKSWLESSFDPVFGFPSFVRFSWATSKNIIKSDGVEVEWDDDGEEDDGGEEGAATAKKPSKKNVQKMTVFFTANENESVHQSQQRISVSSRAPYFRQHCMHVANNFDDYR